MRKFLLNIAANVARILPDWAKKSVYQLGPLTPLLRTLLNRAAPAGIHEVTIAGGLLNGFRFLLDLKTEKDYWLGTYELDLQEAVRAWIRPGQVAYDVGANAGYVSLMLAAAVGRSGQVFAFEALPENIDRLKKNLALNSLEQNVTVLACAVAEKNGEIPFYPGTSDDTGSAAGSAGKRPPQGEAILVESLSLDAFVYDGGHPAPQAVKMDIEGGEVLALPGMRRLLTEAHPLIILELHSQKAAAEAWQTLTGCGYRISSLAQPDIAVDNPQSLGRRAYVLARWQA